jgi:hypothetical protein
VGVAVVLAAADELAALGGAERPIDRVGLHGWDGRRSRACERTSGTVFESGWVSGVRSRVMGS